MPITDQLWHLTKTGGRPMAARLSRWRSMAEKILRMSDDLNKLGDRFLLSRGQELRWKAKSGTPLKNLLPEAFALVREAARRATGKQHYLVQLMGGIALFEGGLAEMQTGEGKTLTATLAAFLRALPGRGCHVVTVNDYLAQRDLELMGPIYEQLGLKVGCVISDSEPNERRKAYHCDITYATSREIGFDFLRDRLKVGAKLDDQPAPQVFSRETSNPDGPVQRGHYFALVDEADSVLIDDAVTPLIIGLNRENTSAMEALLGWCRDLARQLQHPRDFSFDPAHRNVELTRQGARRIILAGKPPLLASFDSEKIYTYVEQALRAEIAFQRGRDYIVTPKEEIAIVDEGTGRTLEGRKWQAGLHQAVEAKERVPITDETGEAARITVQTFFRRYQHLAGMTGTAWLAATEFRKTYNLGVTVIPTNKPCIREGIPPRIFINQQAKRNTLVIEIKRLHDTGRSILIGTPSVTASEALGTMLKELGIECNILNALFHAEEARIISEAGQPGRVTIATNMAGRGTDILLDEAVRANGGLHVFATEFHTNRRIDRQLVGRAARQGDPGSYQFFLSLEDELFRALKQKHLEAHFKRARPSATGELSSSWLRLFQRTQRKIEKQERRQRKQLLKQETSRESMCREMGLDPYLELAE